MMRMGDPLLERIKDIIDSVVEAGIFMQWKKSHFDNMKVRARVIRSNSPLNNYYSFTMKRMHHAFYLLLMGYALSTSIFTLNGGHQKRPRLVNDSDCSFLRCDSLHFERQVLTTGRHISETGTYYRVSHLGDRYLLQSVTSRRQVLTTGCHLSEMYVCVSHLGDKYLLQSVTSRRQVLTTGCHISETGTYYRVSHLGDRYLVQVVTPRRQVLTIRHHISEDCLNIHRRASCKHRKDSARYVSNRGHARVVGREMLFIKIILA
jgi:hypothetical protein